MSDKVDNLVLEQLRIIRDMLGRIEGELTSVRDDLGGLRAELTGHTGVLIALGRYMHDIDRRVEQIEELMGAAQ